jgi:hypothetical protein
MMSIKQEIAMKTGSKELDKLLKDRNRYGGISGGWEASPPRLIGVPAKLGELGGVAFDREMYSYDVQTELGLAMHSVKAKDGREAYFEVVDGKLRSFLCFGLNVEIWQGLLVIGARSHKDDEREAEQKRRRRR